MLFGKHINKFYKKYFWNFFFGILFLIIVDLVQLYVPEIIANLTEINDNGNLTFDIVAEYSLYIFIVAVFMFVGRFVWRVSILNGAHHITADLREEMFVKCEQLSQTYYKSNKVGGIMSYYTNDLDTIQEAFSWGTVMLIDALFLSAMAFYKMLIVEWRLALICLIPLIILVIASYFIDKKIEVIYEERQKAFEYMSDYAQELFTGLRVIKAFVKEFREAKRFKKVNENNKQKDLSLVKFSALLDTIISILIEGMVVIGLSVGAYFVYNNVLEGNLEGFSRADMLEFNGYFNLIIWPMIALGQIISLRSRAKTSLKRVSKLLEENIDVKDLDDVIPLSEKISGKISFKNFSYTYFDGDKPVLKNINIEINAGENIGIVGKIGSGKSTLVNILLRIDNVEKETVFIDDMDIMNIPLKDIRDSIAYVPQDNFLFSTTVKDNVSFANKDLTEDEIIAAAEFADVHDNIVDFVDGYRTLVGERGVTLSGGQKQRISIARAFIKHAPIMILDDSVSAVDVKTEEKILKNIKDSRKGMTTILVASRVSTVEHLDRIIVMNDGCVEAFASHEELLKISPTYQKMVKLQQLEKEVEGGDF